MTKPIHLWVGLSCLLVLSKGAYTASVQRRETVEHDFDMGPLRCCPRPRNIEECPNLSDNIPCTMTSERYIAGKVNYITSIIGNYNTSEKTVETSCINNLRDILCEQSFLSCVIRDDGTHEVQLPSRNTCQVKLNVCPVHLQDFCMIYERTSDNSPAVNYSVASCRAYNITLAYCTIDWYFPEWTYQYVDEIERELDSLRGDLNANTVSDDCWRKLVDFRCRSVGRCWAQGDRLEYINSRQDCEEAFAW